MRNRVCPVREHGATKRKPEGLQLHTYYPLFYLLIVCIPLLYLFYNNKYLVTTPCFERV